MHHCSYDGFPEAAAAPAYPDVAYEQLRAMSPTGAAPVPIRAGGLLQPSSNSMSPTGYSKAPGYSSPTNPMSCSPQPAMQHSRSPDWGISVHRGIYSPILEEQGTATESCWNSPLDAFGDAAAPEDNPCGTLASPRAREAAAAAAAQGAAGQQQQQQQHRWLKGVLKLGGLKGGSKAATQEPAYQHLQQQQQQHQQQQHREEPVAGMLGQQWQQVPLSQQQQQQQQPEQRAWWKPRKRPQVLCLQDAPYGPGSASPGSSPVTALHETCNSHQADAHQQQQYYQQQEADWSAQQQQQQQQQGPGSPQSYYADQAGAQAQQHTEAPHTGYCSQPFYEQQQQSSPQVYQQQHQQQYHQQQVWLQSPSPANLGPFAQTGSQQAVVAGGMPAQQSSGNLGGPAGSNSSGCFEGGAELSSQVVNASSGQVLTVTSGEFQDIITVMQALADARKTLALKLTTPRGDSNGNSSSDMVAAAAAKMAVAAAATAAAAAAAAPRTQRVPSPPLGIPLEQCGTHHAAVKHQQPIAAAPISAASSSNGQRIQPEQPLQQQQWGQPGYMQQQQEQLQQHEQEQEQGHPSPCAFEGRPGPAEGAADDCMQQEQELVSEGHRVYSCTYKGVVAEESSGNSMQGAPQGASHWQPRTAQEQEIQPGQQQQPWVQGRVGSSDSKDSTCYTVTNTTRGPTGEHSGLLALNLSGLNNTGAAGGAGAAGGFSTDAADASNGVAINSSFGKRAKSNSRLQPEPETPHSYTSVKVHAPMSCAGSALPISSAGALTHRTDGASTGRADTTHGVLWGTSAADPECTDAAGSADSSGSASALHTAESCESPLAAGRAAGSASFQGKACPVLRQAAQERSTKCRERAEQGSTSRHGSSGGSCSSSGSVSSCAEMTAAQLELHHTGWTDDDMPPPPHPVGGLRFKFNHTSASLREQRSAQPQDWEELAAQLTPRGSAEHRHLKHLYKKVGDLESGLVKLLSGALITPAAAAALIASLNKIAASGVVKPLSCGGAPSAGGASDNKLVETIQKAALAAAAASSNGGVQPFAGMQERLLASSIGKRVQQQASACSSTTGRVSSRSSDGGSCAESMTTSPVRQRSVGGGKDDAQPAPVPAPTEAAAAPAPANAAAAAPATDDAGTKPKQAQPATQQALKPAVVVAGSAAANSSVMMAMQVLAKAEERLRELHAQEARLKAFLATREAPKAPAAGPSSSRRASNHQSQAPEQQKDGAAGPAPAPPTSRREPGSAAKPMATPPPPQPQQEQRKAGEAPAHASNSRRVSFCEEKAQAGERRARSGNGKRDVQLRLLSPECSRLSELGAPAPRLMEGGSSEASAAAAAAARRRRMLECGPHTDLRACGYTHGAGGSDRAMVADAGCWSDDSTEPAHRLQRQQRRMRQHLKQQRSTGGGCGYESADEPCSHGGTFSGSMDEPFEGAGQFLYEQLRESSIGAERSYDNPHFSAAALHSAPVSSLHATMSRRQMLLAAPCEASLERNLETVSAKAMAKARAKTTAGKPQSFKARQVPANIYESRYSAMVEARLAAHRLQPQRLPASACRQGSYSTRGTYQLQNSCGVSTGKPGSHKAGSASYSRGRSTAAPGSAQQAPMLATSTRSAGASHRASASLSSHGSSTSSGLSDERGGRRHQATPGGLDTVSETHVLRSSGSKAQPSAHWVGHAAARAGLASLSAQAAAGSVRMASKGAGGGYASGSGGYAAGSSSYTSGSSCCAFGSSGYASGGYAAQLKGGSKTAASVQAGGSNSTIRSSSQRCPYPADSGSEADDGAQYLANLFTLRKASDLHARNAVAQQLDALYRTRSPSPSRWSERKARDLQERKASPGRSIYGRLDVSRERSPLSRDLYRPCSSSSGTYSTGGGGDAPSYTPGASRDLRSVSADRSRVMQERVRSADRAMLELLQQGGSVAAGSYASTRHASGMAGTRGSFMPPAAPDHPRLGGRAGGGEPSRRRRSNNGCY